MSKTKNAPAAPSADQVKRRKAARAEVAAKRDAVPRAGGSYKRNAEGELSKVKPAKADDATGSLPPGPPAPASKK